MAMMDNAGFLLAHIRNSFITSDDTGMCELIIENDETDRESKKVSRYVTQNIKICFIFLIRFTLNYTTKVARGFKILRPLCRVFCITVVKRICEVKCSIYRLISYNVFIFYKY